MLARLHGWVNQKTGEHLTAFAEGLRKHGFRVEVDRDNVWSPADLHVAWSRRWIPVRGDDPAPTVFVENAYLGDRVREYMSLGFDDINGWAHRPPPGEEAREQRWLPCMWNWRRSTGHYILLTGQIDYDQTVQQYIPDYTQWVKDTAAALEAQWHMPVRYRPHPFYTQATDYVPLEAELRDATFLVTFNSNSAVDAVMHGVPAITLGPGSMAAEVTAHNVKTTPPTPDRDEWLRKLAWAQWTRDEVRSGKAWNWLREGAVGLA